MAARTTMKAWQFTTASGGIVKNLTLNAAATAPTASSLHKNEVLVEVIAASLNPIDYKIVELPVVGSRAVKTPASPGLDYAGRVVAAHTSVTTLKEGQKVFGRLAKPTQFGTCGQYIIAPIDGCVPLPDGVSPDSAAATGTASLAALQAMKPYLTSGGKIFINGGSGGTGTWAIQFAKALGASEIVTSCSAANAELCTSLGATEVIDYKAGDLVAQLKSKGDVFDLVIDFVGTPENLYKASDSFLKPTGKFVQIGAPASVASAFSLASRMLKPSVLGGGKRAYVFYECKSKEEDLKQIGEWLKEGEVKAVIDQAFEWEDVPRAYEKLKSGRARGKIVVHVTEG